MIKAFEEYILIYGATGLVGRDLVQYFIDKNENIIVLARNKKKAQKIFDDTTPIATSNNDVIKIQDEKNWRCSTVINLAGANIGAKYWTRKYKKQILNSRLKSVSHLGVLIDQLRYKPKVWIQASAVGFYGCNVPKPVDEQGIKGRGFLANVVAKWEHAVDHLNTPDMRKLYLRFGIVITQNGGFLRQLIRVSNFGILALPSVKNQKIPWIHIADLVRLIDMVRTNPTISGKINAVTQQPFEMDILKNLLLKNTRALFKINAPKLLFSIFVGKQKTREMLLANQNVVSAVLPKIKFRFEYTEIQQVFKSNNGN